MPVSEFPFVSIVLLNYRNWRDMIECLESLLRLDYPQFEIIVCDNDSQDGSVERICAWARGEVAPASLHASLAPERAPGWGSVVAHRLVPVGHAVQPRQDDGVRLHVLPTGRNGGFSAGNNVGMRYALARPDVACVWLLNNDTVVAPDALTALVRRLSEDAGIGICGARLLNYEAPCGVQALGGASYVRWRARAQVLLPGDVAGLAGDALVSAVEAQMGYVIGASMLVPRRFIEAVGLLSEAYFLYFEEVDWIRRAAGRYRLGYCNDAVVYHRLGATTGEALNTEFASFHLYRSQMIFVATFDRWALPTVFVLGLFEAAKAFLRHRRKRAWGILRGLTAVPVVQLWALARGRASQPNLTVGA